MTSLNQSSKDNDKPMIPLTLSKPAEESDSVTYPPGMSRDATKNNILKYERSGLGLSEIPFKVMKDFPQIEVNRCLSGNLLRG